MNPDDLELSLRRENARLTAENRVLREQNALLQELADKRLRDSYGDTIAGVPAAELYKPVER